jgi:hypothetical protein
MVGYVFADEYMSKLVMVDALKEEAIIMHACSKRNRRLLKTALSGLMVLSGWMGSAYGQTGDRTAAFAFAERMGTGNNLMASKVILGNAAPEDFALLKQHHFEHCRIGTKLDEHTGSGPNYTVTPAKMADLKNAVDWCIAEGLVAIIDPVHNWAADESNPYSDADLPKLKKIWEQVAAEFASYPLDTVCFEIINEPRTGYSLANIINENLQVIRSTAGNEQRMVIVCGQGFTTRQALINALDADVIPANDDYLIGTYHYYDPKTFTKQGSAGNVNWADGGASDPEFDTVATAFDAVVAANDSWAARNGTDPLPILLGEYGVDNGAPSVDRLRWLSWIRLMAEARGFATSHWNMYNDSAASKGMGPWTTAEKNDPTLRYFHADVVEAMLMRYEAEGGILSGGVSIDTTVPGYTGTGYVTYPGGVGANVYVSVDSMYIPRDDTYTVKIAYATDVDRDVTIQTWDDLGGLVESKIVTLPSTGSFSSWAVAEVDIDFSAGTAGQFQVIADTVQGPNIDWIDVTKTATPPSSGGSSQFNVVADASAKQDVPDNNLGTQSYLQVRKEGASSFSRVAYLKFNVAGLSGTVTNATLNVYSDTEVNVVNALAVSDTTWTETGLTWNNRPVVGSLIGSAQASAGSWFTIDVTSYVTADGTYAIALDEQGNSYHKLGSKEGGFGAYLEVTTSSGGPANTVPSFNSDPVVEINATEDAPYSATLADDASDADSDPLSFLSIGGPSWLTVAFDGALSGTPGNVDVGLNSWTVQVDDGNGGSDSATLNITVINVNDAPTFDVDPINAANATEGAAYSDTIAGTASDIDVGDTLTYSKASGPAWLSVAANGTLSGTPGAGDVGANAFTVQVDDGNGGTDTATLNVTVDAAPVNQAPAFTSDPFSEVDADEGVAYSASIADNASDPESDPMTFSKVSGPAWLSVAANGALSGTPGAGDVGLNAFTVQVDATGGSDTATLNITVIAAPVNQAPSFTADPFSEVNATENAAYSASIADNASDPESDPLTFSKVSGPAWLSVAADGTLSGTPGAGDVGLNAFVVQVDATGGSDTATLNITVDAAPIGWTEILYDDFEGGFGNWTDGGADCILYTGGARAHQGSNAVNLQDNTGTSVMTTGNQVLSGKSEVQVEFWAYPNSFEGSEDFWLQISTNGGSSYTTVKAWVNGVDFSNGTFFSDSVIISGITLTDQTRLRFRCDASGNKDDIYIDEVRVSVQ